MLVAHLREDIIQQESARSRLYAGCVLSQTAELPEVEFPCYLKRLFRAISSSLRTLEDVPWFHSPLLALSTCGEKVHNTHPNIGVSAVSSLSRLLYLLRFMHPRFLVERTN